MSWPAKTNVPSEEVVRFKFFVDAAAAPTLAGSTVSGNPLNVDVASVSRVSQGLFRLTLKKPYCKHVETIAQLNVNAAGQQRFAQPGPVANEGTGTAMTVDILVVDNAGAVQDPAAANANNFISGHVVLCNTMGV
jgi:hypothetical protein